MGGFEPLNPNNSWTRRLQALFEVLLLSGVVSSFLAALFFSFVRGSNLQRALSDVRLVSGFVLLESGITFLLLALVMRAHHENHRSLGLQWRQWRPNAMVGLALVPFLFLTNIIIGLIFRFYFPRYFIEHNPLIEMIHTRQQLLLFIFAALVAGGIKEELQRAFILIRFRRHLGGAELGLVAWSVAFGFGHYIQGVQGIVVATLFGFIFGAVYLIRGNLIAPILAHGLYDALALVGYWLSRDALT